MYVLSVNVQFCKRKCHRMWKGLKNVKTPVECKILLLRIICEIFLNIYFMLNVNFENLI